MKGNCLWIQFISTTIKKGKIMAKKYTKDEWDGFVRKAIKETVEWMLNTAIFNDELFEQICDEAEWEYSELLPEEVDDIISDRLDKVYEVVTRDVCGFTVL